MRWLLSSWGSRGDLHPFLALGRGLVARGHAVTLVGHPEWAGDTAEAGLNFAATDEPPRGDLLRRNPAILSTRWGGVRSLRALMRDAIVPGFAPLLAALQREAAAHDVIVAHHFAFPATMAAELAGKPWATVTLAPGVVPSAYSVPGAQFGRAGEGPLFRARNRFVWSVGKLITRRLVDPQVNAFRRDQGLKPVRDAVFEAHSRTLNLQLYSRHFALAAHDFSAEKRQAGFCFYDPPVATLPPGMEAFLQAGETPVLFTLGSTASRSPGLFYEQAAEACRRTGRRGVLLVGSEENRPQGLGKGLFAASYAPYHLIMPRVRAVVHQCGVGTLSHALRAGLPSVAVPFAFDQPNNAERLQELGVAELIKPAQRSAEVMARALQRLLAGSAPAKAKQLGERIRAEDGVGAACALLEQAFAASAA